MVKAALRWSGVALVAGALGAGATMALISFGLPGRFPTPLASSMLLVTALLLMLALPGMYARQAEAADELGFVGHVLLAVGNVLLIGYAVGALFSLFPGDAR
jgi:hypothetical protein